MLGNKSNGLLFDGEVRALMWSKEKPSSLNDIFSKEEILQSKGSGLLFDGKISALMCSWEKPGSPKDIVFNEEES
eukprot:14719896-Ditylum_brightwellii.AAC.1